MAQRYRFFSLRLPSRLACWVRKAGGIRTGRSRDPGGEPPSAQRLPPVMKLPSASELAGRILARRAKSPAKSPRIAKFPRPDAPFRLSDAACQLSRSTRARKGRDMSTSARATLLESWVAARHAAAELALESAREVPGIRLEPEFVQALASLRTRRVEVYGGKPLLFEETERLAWAIQMYVAALRQPHEGRQRLARAMARVSEAENPADPAPREEGIRVRRELTVVSRGVSQPALIACERRLNQARRQMIEAREGIERDYYITQTGPIESDPFGPFPAEAGGQRQSDSNRRELKPSSSARPKH